MSRDRERLFIRSCDSLRSNKPTNELRGRRRMSMSRALTARALIAEIFHRDRDLRRICQLDVREEVIIFPVRNDSDDELAAAAALFYAWLVRTYVSGERRVVRADTYVGIPSQLQRQCRALSLSLSSRFLFLSLSCTHGDVSRSDFLLRRYWNAKLSRDCAPGSRNSARALCAAERLVTSIFLITTHNIRIIREWNGHDDK